MSKATPRPWHKINDIPTIYAQETNKLIVICSSTYVQENEAKANAELIVRSVNRDHLFDELVKELEWMLKLHDHKNQVMDYSKTRDVLKRARGE